MYKVEILRSAQKQLAKIEPRSAIVQEINELSQNLGPAMCKKLTGRQAWRVRMENYRVIYEINDRALSILIVALGHLWNLVPYVNRSLHRNDLGASKLWKK